MIEFKDIIIFLFGFVSALSMTFIGHTFVKIRDVKKGFIDKSMEFAKPFLEMKFLLDLNNKRIAVSDATDIFNDLYNQQKRAVVIFASNIPKRHRSCFQIAWDNYEKAITQEDVNSWFQGFSYKTDKDIVNKRIYYLGAIEQILYFSDYHNVYSVFRIFNKSKTIPNKPLHTAA